MKAFAVLWKSSVVAVPTKFSLCQWELGYWHGPHIWMTSWACFEIKVGVAFFSQIKPYVQPMDPVWTLEGFEGFEQFEEDLLCSGIFCTFHPELVYFSRLRSCLFLKSWGPSRFLIPAGSEKKYLFSHCPWPGHWFHCEGCLWILRTMCVMGGPLHASLLYMRGYMCSWILVCWSPVVLSVKPYGAPGLGQDSKFMASTEASFNLLLRWLRTRVVLFIDLNFFMITQRCSHIFCFSIEVYNYPFPGYELLVYGAAPHTRTSLDQRVTSLTFLEDLPGDLSLSSGLQPWTRAECVPWKFGSQR